MSNIVFLLVWVLVVVICSFIIPAWQKMTGKQFIVAGLMALPLLALGYVFWTRTWMGMCQMFVVCFIVCSAIVYHMASTS